MCNSQSKRCSGGPWNLSHRHALLRTDSDISGVTRKSVVLRNVVFLPELKMKREQTFTLSSTAPESECVMTAAWIV